MNKLFVDLLKLGQGPRPDLSDINEDNKKYYETPKKGEYIKGLRQIRKEARKNSFQNDNKVQKINSRQIDDSELSSKDKLAIIIAMFEIILPVVIGTLLIFGFLIFILLKFWFKL